ncbi:hypothetical protein BZG79_09625 [Salinivibrio sp. MA427]|uniref:hypothetical protein n=1 Tax=unclassified Salinivibrio TaxID=2636825 RepID=UPI000988C61F|nr:MULTISPECIES: hypothetical protein [unclassified Salinivibrio]OOF04839.1 hypothetical protein BZG81_07980 [Salinivibrio sp. MA607]OOF07520.1 hypothetical protein BZG80_01420 [Salinivibrio sp. MA440]OOF12102.1 hypothetical protein BZG79_09625 [Salinivibrio sp. MA427]
MTEIADWLATLEVMDADIAQHLTLSDIDPEKLAQQLHDRKTLLDKIAASTQAPSHPQWSEALARTKTLIDTLEEHKAESAKRLLQQRKGKQSVQLYKKFQ